MKEYIIGLDWDGTISDYPTGFAFLAHLFSKCIIITVNGEITQELAASTLEIDVDKVVVKICSHDDIENYAHWKAETCLAHHVDIMFDDDPDVVLACLNKGIRAINVSEFIYKYSDQRRYDNVTEKHN